MDAAPPTEVPLDQQGHDFEAARPNHMARRNVVDHNEARERRAELQRFKQEIDLGAYAEHRLRLRPSNGRVYDYPMRPGSYCRFGSKGDQVVIHRPREPGAFYVWTNPENADEAGTIIDLIQKVQANRNLASIRKELREELGVVNPRSIRASFHRGDSPSQPPPARASSLSPEAYRAIRAQYDSARPGSNNLYLATRGLRPETLFDRRFRQTFRVRSVSDEVLFPHQNAEGICGFERKHPTGRTFFSNGGLRGLWCSALFKADKTLVISEGAIDNMSYHQLFPDPFARHMSTSGTLSNVQMELLGRAVARLPADGRVVIATDNDSHRLVEFMHKATGHEFAAHARAHDGSDLHFFVRADGSDPIGIRALSNGQDFECRRISRDELRAAEQAQRDCSTMCFSSLSAAATTLPRLLSDSGASLSERGVVLVAPQREDPTPRILPFPRNPGREYASKIAALVKARRPELTVQAPLLPIGFKDWNEVLKAREQEFIREAQLVRSRERSR